MKNKNVSLSRDESLLFLRASQKTSFFCLEKIKTEIVEHCSLDKNVLNFTCVADFPRREKAQPPLSGRPLKRPLKRSICRPLKAPENHNLLAERSTDFQV